MSEPTPAVIPFGEWAPDRADVTDAVTVALNVLPEMDGYRPMPQPTYVGPGGMESTERVNSLITMRSPSGSAYTFAGTRSGIWRAGRTGWFNATRASGPYVSATPWSFARWGDVVYAVNGHDVMQKLILDSDSNFYDVPGMPDFLTGRYIAVVKNFLVLGYCVNNNGNAQLPYTVRWSGLGRPEDWELSARTQADLQDVPGVGIITGLTGGEFGMVLGTQAWQRFDPAGPPVKMAFTPVEHDIGCDAPGSVIRFQDRTLWYGPKGWRMSNGGASVGVGQGRVDHYTRARLGPAAGDSITSAILPDDAAILFSFRSVDALTDLADELLCYAWQVGDQGRWSHGRMSVEAIGGAATSVYALDDPDVAGVLIDDPAWKDRLIDDPSFAGGSAYPAAVLGGSLYALQRGDVEAVVETGETELSEGWRSTVIRLRPQVTGLVGVVDAQVGARDELHNDVSYTPVLRREKTGSIAVRKSGRWHRIRMQISGRFGRAVGVEVGFTKGGLR